MTDFTKHKKQIKHNYTSELELKSLLIRVKNQREGITKETYNSKINKYLKWYIDITNKNYESVTKRHTLKKKIKANIIKLSEQTCIDEKSYERFGEVILLMIKNILTKPQFSGYTYKDEFYSDAIFKILRYLCNFNHSLISKRTERPVNAFAYISQIIHNSILHIINTKKKEMIKQRKRVQMEHLNHNLQMKIYNKWDETFPEPEEPEADKIVLENINKSLVHEINERQEFIDKSSYVEIYYPNDYRISIEEYNDLKGLLKGKISILRSK